MSTEPNPPNATSEPTTSPAPSSSPPASGTPEFRFGTSSDVPEYARGKTAQEVLKITETLAQAVRTQNPAPPPPPQYQPPQYPQPGNVPSLSLADEFLLRPEEATKKVFAEQMAPALQGIQNMAGQFASVQRTLASQQYATEFAKYGPEIDSLMANVPVEARTLENYEKVVTFIRGKYLNEFAELARQQNVARQTGLGERSGGSGQFGTPNPTGVDFERLPQGMGKVAERAGLTEAQVVDFCKATGITPTQWMEQYLSEKVVTSVAPFSFQVRPEQVGVKRAFDA